jgi:hypothetical protein
MLDATTCLPGICSGQKFCRMFSFATPRSTRICVICSHICFCPHKTAPVEAPSASAPSRAKTSCAANRMQFPGQDAAIDDAAMSRLKVFETANTGRCSDVNLFPVLSFLSNSPMLLRCNFPLESKRNRQWKNSPAHSPCHRCCTH